MAISFTGDFDQFADTVRVGITGVGTGLVNGGSVLDLDTGSMSPGNPLLVLGQEVGSDGTLTVSGTSSRVSMDTGATGGFPLAGAFLSIGRRCRALSGLDFARLPVLRLRRLAERLC